MHFNEWVRDGAREFPSDWQQGRALFGGLAAAGLLRELESCLSEPASVRDLALSFVAPCRPGAFQANPELLREGRSVSQARVLLMQEEQAVIQGFACFGGARNSEVAAHDSHIELAAGPDHGMALPQSGPNLPEFARHFDYRITAGALPFSGSQEKRLAGWIRLRGEDDTPVSAAHILALVDAWPPAVLAMMPKAAPASSLSWHLQYRQPLPERAAGDWWRYEADIHHVADGYAVISARLGDSDGQVLAWSRQTVAVFA